MQCLLCLVGSVNLPYFWDRTPETLPKAELNPLTNPALERNLNRWAEAYFSNPPGKREQAISKLLQEIKNETSEILIAEQARLKSASAEGDTSSSEVRSSEEFSSESSANESQPFESIAAQPHRVVCPTCQFQNPLGHKYCGECGALLHGSQADTHAGTTMGSTFAGWQARPTTRPLSDTQPPDSEVQWLRERNLGSTYAYEPAPSHGWKYAIAGLIIVLGGFAYLQWGSQLPGWIASPAATAGSTSSHPAQPVLEGGSLSAASSSPASSSAASPSTSSATSKPAQTAAAPSGADKPMSVAKSVDRQGRRDTRDQNTLRAGIEPAAQKSSLLATPQAPKPLDSANGGSADLQLAQRYLGGSMGARDSSEAAKLLWKAVRQENTTAAVLLSELYARGDGVPKNCDQARLLLVAAAKRGAPQAAEQLRTLETRGCQ